MTLRRKLGTRSSSRCPAPATGSDPRWPRRPRPPRRLRSPPGDPRRAEPPFPWLRPTIRIRLTLLYGGMSPIAGIMLLSIISSARGAGPEDRAELLQDRQRYVDQGEQRQPPRRPAGNLSLDEFNVAISNCIDHQRQTALDEPAAPLLALLGLAIIAFAFGYAMACAPSPLGRITRTARAVAGSDLSRRIELDGPDDELKELADTFDYMLERLQRAFTAQQRFVGNASHESAHSARDQPHAPSAPATPSPGGAPAARQDAARHQRAQRAARRGPVAARPQRQPDRRAQARGPRRDPPHRPFTRCMPRPRPRVWRSAGVRAAAVVQGNGVLLERIALNLVQNAVRYNVPEGGSVEVTTQVQHGQAVLVVTNTGPVVPAVPDRQPF